jgi:hypothetical protein
MDALDGSLSDSQVTKKKRTLSGRPVGMAADAAGGYTMQLSEQEISGLCSEVNMLQRQNIENEQKIESLTSVTIKLAKTMDTMYESYTDIQRRSMGNNLLLINLEETYEDDLIAQCKRKLLQYGVNPACLDIERAH